ncbi:MAG: hypothetical protein JHC95_08285 [Solirubrobacteraceae bacterium]|nr:hypothetical protein [Solirubrobacteraceae bacterium]
MVRRPSPAMVVACVALIVALGGTGYAATKLPAKSVGREQIRNGAVGNLQIRNGAITSGKLRSDTVTGGKIRNGSVAAKDLAKGVIPTPTTTLQQASGDPLPPGGVGAVSAQCPSGQHATGGGGGFAGPPTTNDKIVDSLPVGDERPVIRWRVSIFNGGTAPRTPVAYVICTAP